MSLSLQVTFDAADPIALSRFWAAALGYVEQPPPDGTSSWQEWAAERGIPQDRWNDTAAIIDPEKNGPRLLFIKVPEGKSAKNRMHLDVDTGAADGDRPAVEAHVTRLTELGAEFQARVDENGEFWVVMTDPEGNEFCVN